MMSEYQEIKLIKVEQPLKAHGVAFYKTTTITNTKWPFTGDGVERRTSDGIF